VGGIPSFVEDGRDGLLFESGDAAGLTRHIETLLQNRERRCEMAEAGRRKAVGQYSWASITERLMKLYEEVIRENPLRK
jgi:glycosyltransferase involved in cell wall biosynthesis